MAQMSLPRYNCNDPMSSVSHVKGLVYDSIHNWGSLFVDKAQINPIYAWHGSHHIPTQHKINIQSIWAITTRMSGSWVQNPMSACVTYL